MKVLSIIEKVFERYLPSPLTLAVLLTLLTFLLSVVFTKPLDDGYLNYSIEVLSYWENGLWDGGLLIFAYQMMLILVLGHVLVLSSPASKFILYITRWCDSTARAAFIISFTTMCVAFFNWGLGLIYGALLVRKVGEYCQTKNIPINYPILGAAGYMGMMVWHGGISGSAPIKINEAGHIENMLSDHSIPMSSVPEMITFNETIFSSSNLIVFGLVVLIIAGMFFFLGKNSRSTSFELPIYKLAKAPQQKKGAEKIDQSYLLAVVFFIMVLLAFWVNYKESVKILSITPNLINFLMIGLGVILHGSFKRFGDAVGEAITDISGILIQFPLYFGIMGIMKSSGLVTLISSGFISIASAETLPIITFFSAGLVNIFVPSGGGQWVVQGPIILEAALELRVPPNKVIMALAYGDQITNMLQPFWALPLLGITKLKAKEILPYTVLAMVVASVIYLGGLWFLF